MQLLTRDVLDRLLTFPALIEDLRTAFAQGGESPERHHHSIGAGPRAPVQLLMPAWTHDAPAPGSFLGTKVVNIFPDNAGKGLPAVMGTYLLHAGETGEPLVAMDGTRLTHWRTAAASALAASYLARADAAHLLIVGAGALAPFLVRAHAAVRPIETVTVWNHRRAGAEQLAAALVGQPWSIRVADDLQAAVMAADLVSCATLSTAPLVRGDWLRPGQHLDLVGAFTPGMREADDAAVRRATIFVDTPAAATEGGDVMAAIASGAIAATDIAASLFDLCRGTHAGRTDDREITLFKSVGTGIEDLAAAVLAWRLLRQDPEAAAPPS